MYQYTQTIRKRTPIVYVCPKPELVFKAIHVTPAIADQRYTIDECHSGQSWYLLHDANYYQDIKLLTFHSDKLLLTQVLDKFEINFDRKARFLIKHVYAPIEIHLKRGNYIC